MNFFLEKEKMETIDLSNLNFFSKFPFVNIYYKNQSIYFLMHGHSSWSTFSIHQVRGAKALEIGPWKLDHQV